MKSTILFFCDLVSEIIVKNSSSPSTVGQQVANSQQKYSREKNTLLKPMSKPKSLPEVKNSSS